MRIVIDTNVWVSGLLWRGLPWHILHLAELGQVELCMAPAMLVELAEVLAYERMRTRITELGISLADVLSYAANLVTMKFCREGLLYQPTLMMTFSCTAQSPPRPPTLFPETATCLTCRSTMVFRFFPHAIFSAESFPK